jgi:MFS family permease
MSARMTAMEDIGARRTRRRSLAGVIGTAFGVGVAVGAVVPLLSLLLEQRGYDAAEIGINAAMSPIGSGCFSILVPRILARLGLLKGIIGSIALTAALILLFPATGDYFAWCVIRLVIGCIGVVHWIASETWLNMLARDASRSRVMGVYATVMAAGFASGPVLLTLTGTEGWLPFAAIAAAALFALVPLLLIGSTPPPLEEKMYLDIFGAMRAVPLVIAAALTAGFIDTALFTLIPVYGVRAGQTQDLAVLTLGVFTAGNLFLQYPLGWIADRTDRRFTAVATAAIVAVGAIAFPLMLPQPGPAFWAMLFVWGGVSWGLYGLGLALLGDRFRPEQLAAANAAFVMTYQVGSITGPVLSGIALDHWPVHGLTVAVSVVAALFILSALARRAS